MQYKTKKNFFVLKGQQRIAQGNTLGQQKNIGTIDYSIYGIRGDMPCVAREILLKETFQQCSSPLFCDTTAKKSYLYTREQNNFINNNPKDYDSF